MVNRLFFVLFFVFALEVFLVYGNNTPCSATMVSGLSIGHNVTLYGTTVNAPTYTSSSCNNGASGTVWFTFTPSVDSMVTITTCGANTNFDTFLGIYDGDCANLLCENYNDDTSCYVSRASQLSFQSSGEQVFVGLSGYSSNEGNYEITFSEVVGPIPSCTNALPIVGPFFGGYAITGSTVTGTQSSVASCGLATETNQVWYTLTTTSPNPLTITTCGPNTDFDTVLALLTGSCTDLECFMYNDDNCTIAGSGASTIHFHPVVSQLYYLVVSGYTGNSGIFDLKISQDQYVQDGCSTAYIVNLDRTQSIQGSTVGGSLLPSNASCSNAAQGPTMWYSLFSPNGNEQVSLTICGAYTNFDASMSIYSDCDESVCIASSSGCVLGSGDVTFALNANQYVYLVVASADGSAGSFEVDVMLS